MQNDGSKIRKKGLTFSLEQAEQEIEARDRRDMSREIAPLKVPDNAIILDNSVHNLHEMAMVMKSHVEKKKKKGAKCPFLFEKTILIYFIAVCIV